jgi:hypothetical protein
MPIVHLSFSISSARCCPSACGDANRTPGNEHQSLDIIGYRISGFTNHEESHDATRAVNTDPDVITATAFVIGLALVIPLGLAKKIYRHKAAFAGRLLQEEPPSRITIEESRMARSGERDGLQMRKGQIFEFDEPVYKFDCYSSGSIVALCLTPKPEDDGRVWWCIAEGLHDELQGPCTVH